MPYHQTYKCNLALPPWLTLAATSLLPMNAETELAKSYRPITCLSFMYKIYTSCLNSLLHHCQHHNIKISEHAVENKEVWGCIEQLLINNSNYVSSGKQEIKTSSQYGLIIRKILTHST